MAFTEQQLQTFISQAHAITRDEADLISGEINTSDPFAVDQGTNFGTGLNISIAQTAQNLRDMSVDQRTEFGEVVATIAISENPGGDPGT